VLPTDPVPPARSDQDRAELARLEGLVAGVLLPAPALPGWQSLTAIEYGAAVVELGALLGTVRAALAAAREAA